TFRALIAALLALVLSFVLGPWLIRRLTAYQIGQTIRPDGPQAHLSKAGTPTMGGTLILFSLLLTTLLLSNLANMYVWLVIVATLAFAAIGFIDDYGKLRNGHGKGLTAKAKFGAQTVVALAAVLILIALPGSSTEIYVPFLKDVHPDLGWWYVPAAVFIIVGASNAVNLTDGLDGLAIGPVMTTAFTYGLFAYIIGNVKLAQYLQLPYVAGAGELSIFCGALVFAGLGFLWFNTYPAMMFMGDVGSLPLGAALALVALITKQELVLLLAGGVFVAEALSVIIQVSSYKMRRKRVFRMAPVHHHFELLGWPEPKVIVRFWIASIICTVLALSTLKLR
ncbi:MAG TPA: phospho-N-acetylmuramoyl-pentapeptide-transferase, partial [Terriglobales bacterium]|nr:phospho-N-acetylmuramoyl-pentapeptide-transferase [Terriglobales bacterium]